MICAAVAAIIASAALGAGADVLDADAAVEPALALGMRVVAPVV
jgi:hypothetical protein